MSTPPVILAAPKLVLMCLPHTHTVRTPAEMELLRHATERVHSEGNWAVIPTLPAPNAQLVQSNVGLVDEVFMLNQHGDQLSTSAKSVLIHAKKAGKPVRWWTPEAAPTEQETPPPRNALEFLQYHKCPQCLQPYANVLARKCGDVRTLWSHAKREHGEFFLWLATREGVMSAADEREFTAQLDKLVGAVIPLRGVSPGRWLVHENQWLLRAMEEYVDSCWDVIRHFLPGQGAAHTASAWYVRVVNEMAKWCAKNIAEPNLPE